MAGVDCRVAAHAATLPSLHPAHTNDHLGRSMYALAWGILMLAQEITRMLSHSSDYSRWGYPEYCEREGLVPTGTPQTLHEAAE